MIPIAHGPRISRPPARTAPANTAIALSVTLIARLKVSSLPVARLFVRFGRIDVWIAWNSCVAAGAGDQQGR